MTRCSMSPIFSVSVPSDGVAGRNSLVCGSCSSRPPQVSWKSMVNVLDFVRTECMKGS